MSETAQPATEEWRSVVGYEGQYEVSDMGRVRSLDRLTYVRPHPRCPTGFYRPQKGVVLEQLWLNTGRLFVNLWKECKSKTSLVNILVCRAFCGPKPKGHEVNHKDGCCTNNVASNLEWMTSKQNHEHAARMGLSRSGERSNLSRLKKHQVLEIRRLRSEGLSAKELAKIFSISQGHVFRLINKENWKYI